MTRKRDLASAVHGAARAQDTESRDTAQVPSATQAELGDASGGESRGYRPPSRVGTKAVVIHVAPSLSKTLRRLALDMDTSVQALGLEAFEDLLKKHRSP